jgi:hypothetical protein
VVLSGSNVTQWNDKSGNNRHASNATTATAPTYVSGQYVQFTKASQQFLNLPNNTLPVSSSSAHSFFFVVTPQSTGTDVFFSQTGESFLYLQNNSPTGQNTFFTFVPSSGRLIGYGQGFVGTRVLLERIMNPSTISSFANGTNISNVDFSSHTVAGTSNQLGGVLSSLPASAFFHEAILFNTTLTAPQRQQIEGYLAAKWGLSTALPPAIQAVPSVFDPRTISGCSLWLDAADSSSMTLSGSNVTQWRDKTTNGHILTGVNTNTLVSTGIQITGSASGGSGTLSGFTNSTVSVSMSNRSVFLVFTQTLNQFAQFVGFGPAGANIFGSNDRFRYALNPGTNSADIYANNGSTLNIGTIAGTVPALRPTIFVDIGNNTSPNISFFVNGSTAGVGNFGGTAPTSVSAAGFQIARLPTGSTTVANEFFNGIVHEIIVFNATLTAAQRQQIEGYLYAKWNVPVTRHPYYRGLPMTPLFVPSQLSGLSLWLDAADSSTLTLSGSNVTQWNDKSGNGRHATQSTIANQPTLSGTLINFNGSQFLNMTDAYNMLSSSGRFYTLFVVERRGSATNSIQFMIGGGGSTGNQVLIFGYNNNTTTLRHTAGIAPDLDYIVPGWGSPDPIRMWGGGYNGSIRDTWLNGSLGLSQSYSTTIAAWTQPVIGYLPGFNVNQFYTGNIYEILFFNSYLTTTQRQAVEGYLAWKWGLQDRLPVAFGGTIASPLAVSGCALWLDGADASSVTFGTGSNITSWNDKSGNNRNATQFNTGFATYDSINRRTVITPTGQLSSPIPAGTFSSGIVAFVVFQKYGANTTYDALISRTNLNGPFPAPFDIYADTVTQRLIGNGGNTNFGGYNTNESIFRNTSMTLYNFSIAANATWRESVNGQPERTIALTSQSGTPTYGDTGSLLYIGTRGDKFITANVYIYEIVLYSGTLTTTQRQQVEGYLQNKWKLNPPIPHPYKNFRA